MADDKISDYTQGLLDTVVMLRKEIDNLRIGYDIIHKRLEKMVVLSDRTTSDAVKEAISIEELARLAVVAADTAYKAALILQDADSVDKTQKTLNATQSTHASAQTSTIDSKARQTGGGLPKAEQK